MQLHLLGSACGWLSLGMTLYSDVDRRPPQDFSVQTKTLTVADRESLSHATRRIVYPALCWCPKSVFRTPSGPFFAHNRWW